MLLKKVIFARESSRRIIGQLTVRGVLMEPRGIEPLTSTMRV